MPLAKHRVVAVLGRVMPIQDEWLANEPDGPSRCDVAKQHPVRDDLERLEVELHFATGSGSKHDRPEVERHVFEEAANQFLWRVHDLEVRSGVGTLAQGPGCAREWHAFRGNPDHSGV